MIEDQKATRPITTNQTVEQVMLGRLSRITRSDKGPSFKQFKKAIGE